ncbi:hypothetical protein [Gimesia sp.]|mgnify:CR=1 FL=1|uniref:hypothetical protein n=1 Tax=Gimesia sp. TaxID=2024833 RepID=UPI000C364709|nr:hypothetical protein [Gimesia sp.]MAX37577.1 hypothetical protein [Gimesia sp.]HAH47344.1 hypothetical protein [Planctomycetaceae bacterium]|tara:strand:+ start:67440 stop:68312 length:873 start_codon:yes stop_codon:yes gene_type:complete
MSFVGKVLVVVQVVLSVCFMGFAGAVFTAQNNWRNESLKLKDNVASLQKSMNELESEFNNEKTEMTKELNKAQSEAETAKAANEALLAQTKTLQTQLDTARVERDTSVAQAETTGEEAKFRRQESDRQRVVNKSLHDTVNELRAKIKGLEDTIFTQSIREKNLVAKHTKVVEELNYLNKIVANLGIDPQDPAIAGMQSPPPAVEGLIINTKKDKRNGTRFVEVSLGSDDGLSKGHQLFVYRFGTEANGNRPKYLGKIELVYVDPDKAVGTVIDAAKNGVIEKGDHVNSKL